MSLSVQHIYVIKEIDAVTFQGILRYDRDPDRGWLIDDGTTQEAIEPWIEKFQGASVTITIKKSHHVFDDGYLLPADVKARADMHEPEDRQQD